MGNTCRSGHGRKEAAEPKEWKKEGMGGSFQGFSEGMECWEGWEWRGGGTSERERVSEERSMRSGGREREREGREDVVRVGGSRWKRGGGCSSQKKQANVLAVPWSTMWGSTLARPQHCRFQLYSFWKFTRTINGIICTRIHERNYTRSVLVALILPIFSSVYWLRKLFVVSGAQIHWTCCSRLVRSPPRTFGRCLCFIQYLVACTYYEICVNVSKFRAMCWLVSSMSFVILCVVIMLLRPDIVINLRILTSKIVMIEMVSFGIFCILSIADDETIIRKKRSKCLEYLQTCRDAIDLLHFRGVWCIIVYYTVI